MTLESVSTSQGLHLAEGSITVQPHGTVHGRLFSLGGGIDVDRSRVSRP